MKLDHELDVLANALAREAYAAPKKPPRVQTNADRIRAMSDEELKVYLCYISDCSVCLWQSCNGCKLEDWLKQPYKEDK